jgi:hypothetical protein
MVNTMRKPNTERRIKQGERRNGKRCMVNNHHHKGKITHTNIVPSGCSLEVGMREGK